MRPLLRPDTAAVVVIAQVCAGLSLWSGLAFARFHVHGVIEFQPLLFGENALPAAVFIALAAATVSGIRRASAWSGAQDGLILAAAATIPGMAMLGIADDSVLQAIGNVGIFTIAVGIWGLLAGGITAGIRRIFRRPLVPTSMADSPPGAARLRQPLWSLPVPLVLTLDLVRRFSSYGPQPTPG